MKKFKTHKGAVKRIKISGSGKLLRLHARASHHQGRKRAKVKLRRKEVEHVLPANPRIDELIPSK